MSARGIDLGKVARFLAGLRAGPKLRVAARKETQNLPVSLGGRVILMHGLTHRKDFTDAVNKLNDDWTLTLFPSLPLALLAMVSLTPPPASVLLDDDSVLNAHVSALRLPQLGYAIRTFGERTAQDLAGRPELLPSTHLAVHHDLDALARRSTGTCGGAEKKWNHVESITENELFQFSSWTGLPLDSATIRLRGFPSAVALLARQGSLVRLPGIMASLGLEYQEGHSLGTGALG
jgi:hypothetical protein